MQQSGRGGVASSCAPCWLTAGTQGMRVSEQEDFKAAESQEPGAGSCAHTFRSSCGKAQKPTFHKRFVKAHRGQGPGGEGAPMNHVNQRGLPGLLPRMEGWSLRALTEEKQRSESGGRQKAGSSQDPSPLPTVMESHSQKGGPQQRRPHSGAFRSRCLAGGSAIHCQAGPQAPPGTRVRARRATPGHRAGE